MTGGGAAVPPGVGALAGKALSSGISHLAEVAMRTSIRSRVLPLATLSCVVTLAACVGGLPYRRSGSDLVTRGGPSNSSWLERTIACSARSDSAKRAGASGSADDCENARADTGAMRDPNKRPGHKTP